MRGWLGTLIVNFVLLLICFIAYSSQIFIIWPWYGYEVSVELITLLGPFNVLVALLLWNYFLCVTVDPGRVPAGWKPDSQEDGLEVKKLTGTPRYCRMCEQYKPPRTHHCRQCNKCTLRMDHHCPWINNCVGHYNYGHFIRFLFYVDIACSYHIFMVTRRVMSMSMSYWDMLTGTELVMIILNYVACIPVLLAVGGFSLYHFWGLMGNTTTIEGWEKNKAATMVKRGKIHEVKYPYHLGRRRNIESVLGTNTWLWCWPTPAPGNGLKFELTAGDDVNEALWPPKEPDRSRYEDPKRGFVLPDSPWTYEDGGFNPELQPSNSRQLRQRAHLTGATSLPPYHPEYDPDAVVDDMASDVSFESEDEDHAGGPPRTIYRRGSEGYEIRPVGREDMLRRYLEELGEQPGRYNRYVPEPDSEGEEEYEESVPLGQLRERVKQQ